MPLPNFGIPDTDEAIAAVRQAIDANHAALSSVYQAMGEPVVNVINNNDTALSLVQSALTKKVRQAIGTNTRRLNSVYKAVAGDYPGGTDWAVWQTAQGACYTQPAGFPGLSPGDVLLSGGMSQSAAEAMAADCNAGAAPPPPPAQPPVTPAGFPRPPAAPTLPAPGMGAPPSPSAAGAPVPVSIPSPGSLLHPPPHRPAHPLDTAEGTARVLGFALPGAGAAETGGAVPLPYNPTPQQPGQFPPPQPPIGGPPPHSPPPGIPPIGEPVTVYYWAYRANDCGTFGAYSTADPAEVIRQTLGPPMNYLDAGGPFANIIDAHNALCAAHPDCPACRVQSQPPQPPIGEPPHTPPPVPPISTDTSPPTPCPPTPCPPCPVDHQPPPATPSAPCDIPALPDATHHPVGSPEWCAMAQQLRTGLVAIGHAILAVAESTAQRALGFSGPDGQPAGPSSIFSGIPYLLPGGQALAIPDALRALFGAIVSNAGPQLQAAVQCWLQVVRSVAPCPPDDLVAMGVVRAALSLLHKLRTGTDAAVWITTDIEVYLDPIERVVEYLMQSLCPAEIPSIGESIECYLRNTITDTQFSCWMLCRGADPGVWQPVLNSRREQLTAQEYIQWARRHGLSPETQAALIRRLGWTNPEEAAARVELYDELPTVADFIHFITRNVYDTDYVRDYQLDEGFEERMWATYGPTLEAIGLNKRWAKEHYRAHWITASPGQLREMVHRLRPDKPGVQNPMTTADFERLLTEQDIAPWIRRRFVETVYNVPALSYIVEMFRNYTVTDDELRSVHLDLGFSPQDADRFLAVDKLRRSRMRAAEAHGWTPNALAKAYISGQITADAVTAEMASMGYTEEESRRLMARAGADLAYTTFTRARSRAVFAALSEVRTSLSVGVMDGQTAVQTLLGMGWPQDFAAGWVNVQTASARVAIVRQGVSVIRGSYYRGEVARDQAAALLGQLGIVPDMITQYISLWAVRLTRKRRTLSRAEILRELCSGHIGIGDAIVRLQNLGYDGTDIELYLADAGQCIAQRRAKAESLAARQAATESKELLKLEKEAKAQARSLLKEAEKAEPVSKLVKWAAMGEITASYFCSRMRRYGYDNDEIQHYWSEAVARKGSQADASAIADCLQQRSRPEPGTTNATGP